MSIQRSTRLKRDDACIARRERGEIARVHAHSSIHAPDRHNVPRCGTIDRVVPRSRGQIHAQRRRRARKRHSTDLSRRALLFFSPILRAQPPSNQIPIIRAREHDDDTITTNFRPRRVSHRSSRVRSNHRAPSSFSARRRRSLASHPARRITAHDPLPARRDAPRVRVRPVRASDSSRALHPGFAHVVLVHAVTAAVEHFFTMDDCFVARGRAFAIRG